MEEGDFDELGSKQHVYCELTIDFILYKKDHTL